MSPLAPRTLVAGWLRNPWVWLGLGLTVVYLRGLFLDLMDVDASQYASISMEMAQNGQWLQVQHRHADYLDKPPLLFWTSAASFLLFGLHNWSYKLPSFMGALAGVYAVYRFCRLFYSPETARHAAFMLAASVGGLLLCNDVRTDTLLLGMTACAVWQLAAYVAPGTENRNRWGSLLLAGLFTGLAMLAKGPIGLIVPLFALGAHLALRRDWRQLWRWQWLVGLGVSALVLLPMCWGLYQQYDLHPDKVINGRTGVSGLYFFFWEQSFGRITGENVWKNDTSAFYFLHVYLWAFLPWSLLLVGAIWRRIAELFRQKFYLMLSDEAFSLGGFVLTFVALSMSRYKLPHYIFITLPWAAVLTARWLGQLSAQGKLRPAVRVQYGVFLLLATLSFLLLAFVFPGAGPLVWAVSVGIFGGLLWQIMRGPRPIDSGRLVQWSVLAFLGAAFVLNFHFYPRLLPYQSTAEAARFARRSGMEAGKLAFFHRHGHALDFYAGRILPEMKTPDAVRDTAAAKGDYWLYTDEAGKAQLDSAGVEYTLAASFGHFQVALIKPAFLNPATRTHTLMPVYLLEIQR